MPDPDSGQSEANNTVRIDAGRFEQSPYFEFYANPQTILGVAAGRYYPADLGEDTEETYRALRNQAVLFDVPEKPWQIDGPDAVAFLELIFSRRIETLNEGRGLYTIACTPEGGTFMDGILFKLAPNRYWYVQADGAFEEWLIAHKAGFDVRISDPHSRVLQIQGPSSMQIMHDATAGAIDENMKYFHSGYFDLAGQQLYVSRTGWTGELGFEIYSNGEATDHKKLWDHLLEIGSRHGMTLGSLKAMGIRRIEAGILDNGSDFDPWTTPFQAGLGKFIDLDKPDFIGKAALLDAEQKTLLYGLTCPEAEPRNGDEIYQETRVVGTVTASAWSPLLECGIGYVRFTQPGDWAGKSLSLKMRSGNLLPCDILDLPFYDADKQIPRGN